MQHVYPKREVRREYLVSLSLYRLSDRVGYKNRSGLNPVCIKSEEIN